MVTLLRLAACSVPLLIGLTSRCFVPQFAIVALLRYRLQVSFAHWTSASPVSRTARGEAPSHWARASCAPRHYHPQFAMVVPHLRTALAFGGAVFRGCALRFASCARHSSPSGLRCAALPPLSSAWSLRIVRKLTCGAPCFTGLIDGYCSHWLRRLFRPHWAYYGLYRAQRAAFVRPYQFPLKSYGFPGAETAKKRFLLWKMRFFGAKISPVSAAQVVGDD